MCCVVWVTIPVTILNSKWSAVFSRSSKSYPLFCCFSWWIMLTKGSLTHLFKISGVQLDWYVVTEDHNIWFTKSLFSSNQFSDSHTLYEACSFVLHSFIFPNLYSSFCLYYCTYLCIYERTHAAFARICDQTAGFPHWTRIIICYLFPCFTSSTIFLPPLSFTFSLFVLLCVLKTSLSSSLSLSSVSSAQTVEPVDHLHGNRVMFKAGRRGFTQLNARRFTLWSADTSPA